MCLGNGEHGEKYRADSKGKIGEAKARETLANLIYHSGIIR